MAHILSIARAGWYNFPLEHLPLVMRMFTNPHGKAVWSIDPCAGDGVTPKVVQDNLDSTMFAIELEENKYHKNKDLFGSNRTLHGDMFHTIISRESFQFAWMNPPFMEASAEGAKNREELEFIAAHWNWVQARGFSVLVVYRQHVSMDFLRMVYTSAENIRPYWMHDDLLGYDFVIFVATKRAKGRTAEEARADQAIILQQFEDVQNGNIPHLEDSPIGAYELPAPASREKFVFTTKEHNFAQVTDLLIAGGAHLNNKFIVAHTPEPMIKMIRPPAEVREGHMLILVLAGAFNYLPINTERGAAIIRAQVEQVRRSIDQEFNDKDEMIRQTFLRKANCNITLTYGDGSVESLSDIESIGNFIVKYMPQLIWHADKQFPPRYSILTPYEQEPNKQRYFPHIGRNFVKGKHLLYAPQRHAAAALLTTMAEGKYKGVMLLAAMGTGKTNMSLAVMDSWQRSQYEQQKAEYRAETLTTFVKSQDRVKPGQIHLVICPGHLVEKWGREAVAQLPDSMVKVLDKKMDMLTETAKFLEAAKVKSDTNRMLTGRDDTVKLLIVSQDTAKNGEGWYGFAARYEVWGQGRTHKEFHMPMNKPELCERKREWLRNHGWTPSFVEDTFRKTVRQEVNLYEPHTHTLLQIKTTDAEGKVVYEPMIEAELHKSQEHCDAPLLLEMKGESKLGYKYGRYAVLSEKEFVQYPLWSEKRSYNLPKGKKGNGRALRLGREKDGSSIAIATNKEPILDAWLSLKGIRPLRNVRGPLWRIFAKTYKGLISVFVCDEAHENVGYGTDRSDNLIHIAKASDWLVLMTGTAMNGYASSMYTLCTLINPALFRLYPNTSAGRALWVRDMGALVEVEQYTEYKETGSNTNVKRKRTNVKEEPSASPLLIAELLPYSVILQTHDVMKYMPKKNEHIEYLELSDEMAKAYKRAEKAAFEYGENVSRMVQQTNATKAVWLRIYEFLLGWLDSPHMEAELLNSEGRVVTSLPAIQDLSPKEKRIVEIVNSVKLSGSNGVGIFCQEVGKRDMRERLNDVLEELTPANTFVLSSGDAEPKQREAYLQAAFDSGVNTLITNGSLVKTGLDLLNLPTLICFGPEIQLTTLEQMMQRAWRIGQENECNNHYLCYTGTVQAKLWALIMGKRAALQTVFGDLDGLESVGLGSIMEQLRKNVAAASIEDSLDVINKATKKDSVWYHEDGVYFEPIVLPVNAAPIHREEPALVVFKRVETKVEGLAQLVMF